DRGRRDLALHADVPRLYVRQLQIRFHRRDRAPGEREVREIEGGLVGVGECDQRRQRALQRQSTWREPGRTGLQIETLLLSRVVAGVRHEEVRPLVVVRERVAAADDGLA